MLDSNMEARDQSSEPFTPAPYVEVSGPAQLKVFTDPLRIRVLNVLSQREATNQQVADSLGEPTAKVLYHVRFLLDAGIIRLVRTEVKGGNVEKYYRAIALAFVLTPAQDGIPEYELGAATAVLDAARHEAVASLARWPDQDSLVERLPGMFDATRMAEFQRRLTALLNDYWGEEPREESPAAVSAGDTHPPVRWRLLLAVYRDPTANTP
jgi:DNA-binding transcriptional ArsR family regulator